MIRSLITPLVALLSLLAVSTDAIAQQPRISQIPGTKSLQDGDTIRSKDGKQQVHVTGGGASVHYTGKLRPHATEPDTWICDEITDCSVSSGGATHLWLKGKVCAEINRSGTNVSSVTSGVTGDTDGAQITVTGDNVTVNANATNTSVDCKSSAQNTTVNANSGSSGTVSYPQGGGFSGSMNVQAGAGNWSLSPH